MCNSLTSNISLPYFFTTSVFLVIPIITFIISLMARDQEAWRNTAASWVILVGVTFCVWALAVTHRQMLACYLMVERCFPFEGEDLELSKWTRFTRVARKALVLTQTARYSGIRMQRFHVVGDVATSEDQIPLETRTPIYTRFTSIPCFSKWIFDKLDPPKRVYTPEEVREILPFMTRSNFNLQKFWFGGDSHQRSVVVARGPSALTLTQIKNSVVCTILGIILMTLLLIGFLVWMEVGIVSYVVVAVISLICCVWPLCRNSQEIIQMYESVQQEDVNDSFVTQDDSEINLFHVWETERLTQPKERYCYVRIVIELVIFFLWPFISMLVKRNYPVAIIFFVLGGFTFLWRYFDASAVLSEIGSLTNVAETYFADDPPSHLMKYRLSEVIGRINNVRARRVWYWIFVVSFLAILLLFFGAQQDSEQVNPTDRGSRPPILLLDDFYYPPQNDSLAYPTCKSTQLKHMSLSHI